jgi:hypothetical protein
MSKTVADKLAAVLEAVRALPEDSQEAIVHELAERVSDFSGSHMTEAQRAEVGGRVALPRRHVPDDSIREILRRYNPSL